MVSYAWCSHDYAHAWHSDLTLWSHASDRAPLKPRPRINLAVALMEQRRFTEAWVVLAQADRLLAQDHLTDWDRADAARAIQQNRLLLSRLDPANPR